MLSYMVPSIEEKPPPGPTTKTHLQLDLPGGGGETQVSPGTGPPSLPTVHPQHLPTQPALNGHPRRTIIKTQSKTSTISAESSVSSLSSVMSSEVLPGTHVPHSSSTLLTPSQDKTSKHKVLTNGATKHPTLKRVSFGSSKGSMVETLIYESPLQEEPEPNPSSDQTSSTDSNQGSESVKASKVRVTFFECEKPLLVSSPEPSDQTTEEDGLDAPSYTTMTTHINPDQPSYNRQASTDSGWDNPFRPDGDLSREADEIVELIKGGKPITPTPGSEKGTPFEEGGGGGVKGVNGGVTENPVKAVDKGGVALQGSSPNHKGGGGGVNGGGGGVENGGGGKGEVEPQRGTLASPASDVERVNLKKKPKCKCCVIQ